MSAFRCGVGRRFRLVPVTQDLRAVMIVSERRAVECMRISSVGAYSY